MAKQYFYTDPLKAAWMAREFDFIFQYSSYSAQNREFLMCGVKVEIPWDGKIYIDPDCHALLEPQVGDDLQLPDYDQVLRVASEGEDINVFYRTKLSLLAAEISHYGEPKIIQRGGIAFFTPESEEISEEPIKKD